MQLIWKVTDISVHKVYGSMDTITQSETETDYFIYT